MKMKKYMDIESMREASIDAEAGTISEPNCNGFIPGERIVIQTMVNGRIGSFEYDASKDHLIAYSEDDELDQEHTNHGFWDYIQSLSAEEFREDCKYVPFGEWITHAGTEYEEGVYHKFFVFDIWNKRDLGWMDQDFVKEFCKRHHLEYVNTIYNGPFVSWEHCRSFLNHHWKAKDLEEGIVIKSLDRLRKNETHLPVYLKITNKIA